MAKDPAFLFYPNDWLGGTLGMTFEQKGAYIELLMLQFNRGHMTEHMIGQTVGQLFGQILDKFVKDDAGLWYNPRLDEEKEKRINYVNSRKNNKLGVNQYKKKQEKEVGHMTYHMEDENEDNVLGSLKVKEIANKVWEDEAWKQTTCMGLSVTIDEFKKWLALFNSSIANDNVKDFGVPSYKKCVGGGFQNRKRKELP